jgi:hypothetical protein
MDAVYRKTNKGQTELDTRAFGLSPRLRLALILVDGKKTAADLEKLILADPFIPLGTLMSEGFIEVAAEVTQAPPQPTMSVDVLKRKAARFLINKLGPTAEGLAMALERADGLTELQPLLASATRTLRNVGRDALADEFIARFVTPLEA